MPGVSDIFDGAPELGLLPELAMSRTEPRERDLLHGSATAGQPSPTLGAGRMTHFGAEPVEMRLYDEQTEFRPLGEYGTSNEISDLLFFFPLNAVITKVNAAAFTYSARADIDPAIVVTDETPKSRQIDPATITTTLASIGDPCTIMVRANGRKYLWAVQEIVELDEACVV